MTTLITITRQSPNTTNNNNNYLSHSKIFGCKKKGILVVSFHSAPFSLSLSLPP
ncbi:Biofilm-and planktonic growth-induced protein [Candida albicans P76055]|nr:Biofilm-and planktonic growth-induced protein [Candida albicans P76055]